MYCSNSPGKPTRDMRIARVFPRRTKATPDDALSFVGDPPLIRPDIEEVHVSVAFTWDLPEAKRLTDSWGRYYPTTIGGPATGQRSEQFEPGMYLKPGYTITSRGCPNRCWFCDVWKREGAIRELSIRDGWNVLDDNILACSQEHFAAVCGMLKRQTKPSEFTGGLEAARLTAWHVDQIAGLSLKQVFLAYDTEDDYEPLISASMMLREALEPVGHKVRCYCLVGYPGDTFSGAEKRLKQILKLGIMPMAMLYRPNSGRMDREWRQFQRTWAAPQAVAVRMREHAPRRPAGRA
jgi:hypothetical protein